MTYTTQAGVIVNSTLHLTPAQTETLVNHLSKENLGYDVKKVNVTKENNQMKYDCEMDPKPVEHIRRITGYLVGTLDKFNDGKKAEEKDRVKHV